MSAHRVEARYRTRYADLAFERAGLFRAIERAYGAREVLYPGSSIHITPSLYFPHVVYVDRAEEAREFFADAAAVLAWVASRQRYRQPARLQFIAGDYSCPLSLRDSSFDLLLALFAGGVTRSCRRYVRRGGIVVTNNHEGDAVEAALDPELALAGAVEYRGQAYQLRDDALDARVAALVASAGGRERRQRHLRRTSQGAAYVEGETYFVFRRR